MRHVAYSRDIVNSFVNSIFGPHCRHIYITKCYNILTDSGYIMLDLVYVLIDNISNLIDSYEYSRDFFSLVVNG